ncbi:hypothetical protein WJX81_005200 [Elliptochloris bilobata]|uniref:Uncharacterized protein n=1 Tax=Elliptochloris bilobata TaxID=381761 RepID=A0AAW1QX93_9CHLO
MLGGFIRSELCTPGETLESGKQASAGIGSMFEAAGQGGALKTARVSAGWLSAYLTEEQQSAVSRLSVFAGSFSVAGATTLLTTPRGARQPNRAHRYIAILLAQSGKLQPAEAMGGFVGM